MTYSFLGTKTLVYPMHCCQRETRFSYVEHDFRVDDLDRGMLYTAIKSSLQL